MRPVILALALSTSSFAAAARQPPAGTPAPRAVLENGELMALVIKPAYAELQAAMAAAPGDRLGWAGLYQKAARLAEFENLLFFRLHERAATPEWQERAGAARDATGRLADLALLALTSTAAQDFPALKARYTQIAATCNACHRQFGRREAPTIVP